MKRHEPPVSPSSSSSSSSSSSPSRSSSSTLTMMVRWGSSRRHPLPPSDSQDLEDDVTLTEGGGGGGQDDDSLPRSPASTRTDRRFIRTQAYDLETPEDFPQPRLPRVELRRPSCGSGSSGNGGRKNRREQLSLQIECPLHRPDNNKTPSYIKKKQQQKKEANNNPPPCFRFSITKSPDDPVEIPEESTRPPGGSQRPKYEVLPYDPHPKLFREGSFSLRKDYLTAYDAYRTRRSSFGCEYTKDSTYSWEDQGPATPGM
ncbi:hypothetical protein Hamer_G009692 [Homarus americanus]|uniref:Uncharacterized protein n=1 Tax=Homarus americanus TaxID=6706 RepID=A0A8J5N2Y7_HOMAM|nr:hypothetical protein Hamer_G009692 [Homarus americanus]